MSYRAKIGKKLKMENGKIENGEWRMENGKIENGEWRMEEWKN